MPADSQAFTQAHADDADFARFVRANVVAHKQDGYAIINISLKPIGGVPGDATDAQMDVIADLAERFSHDEVRVTHEQNLVLPHVKLDDVKTVYDALAANELATANLGLISDQIACRGLIIAISPMPAPFRWRRKSPSAFLTSTGNMILVS